MTYKEYYDKVFHESIKRIGKILFAFIVGVLICTMFSSCVTKREIEYRDRDVNHYITKVEKDTVTQHTHDSIYFEVIQKGDTVFSLKYKEKTRWRDRVVERHDTCWRDSIVTEYKETVKEVTKIPKIYTISLFFSIGCIIFAIIKLVKWAKTF